MYYYKQTIYTYHCVDFEVNDESFEPISEAEYNSALETIYAQNDTGDEITETED